MLFQWITYLFYSRTLSTNFGTRCENVTSSVDCWLLARYINQQVIMSFSWRHTFNSKLRCLKTIKYIYIPFQLSSVFTSGSSNDALNCNQNYLSITQPLPPPSAPSSSPCHRKLSSSVHRFPFSMLFTFVLVVNFTHVPI